MQQWIKRKLLKKTQLIHACKAHEQILPLRQAQSQDFACGLPLGSTPDPSARSARSGFRLIAHAS